MKKVAAMRDTDTVVTSIVGIAGLIPTLEAIRNGKNIALANKETLVTAGSLVISEAKAHKAGIFPVDSEHSAIFQCLKRQQASGCQAVDPNGLRRAFQRKGTAAFWKRLRRRTP